jgi:ubiquinone/menaquinone biosynthesis C-methylase UbiE
VNKSNSVCSWQLAWGLDNWARRIIQDPHKILRGCMKEGDTVLDLGCGPGVFSIAMAEMVGDIGRVISVDIQDEMLQILKQKSVSKGLESRIHIHKSQPDKIGLSEKLSDNVDFALAFYMVHEVPNIERFLREAAALLKPQGRLLIVEPKFHVSKSSFEKTIEIAKLAGLAPISWPRVLFSRGVLLRRNSS